MLFVSREVAIVIFGSISSAPVVLSHWGALEGGFFPLLLDLEAKYSLNSSSQEKKGDGMSFFVFLW